MKFLWWIPAVVSGLIIFWFSGESQPPAADLGPDYVLHFFGFGFFSVSVTIGVSQGFRLGLSSRQALLAFLISFAYACIDEFHQSFVPGRTSAVADVLADSVGAFVFLTGMFLILRFRNRQLQS